MGHPHLVPLHVLIFGDTLRQGEIGVTPTTGDKTHLEIEELRLWIPSPLHKLFP